MGAFDVCIVCGSLRTGSYNRVLSQDLKHNISALGLNAIHLDLKHLDLPIFDQDMIDGSTIPNAVLEARSVVHKSKSIIFVSPEYCGGMSGAMKNFIDWMSVPLNKDEKIYSNFTDKVIACAVVTVSKTGGIKCAENIRSVAGNLRCVFFPSVLIIQDAANVHDLSETSGKFISNFLPFFKRFSI